MKFIGNIKKALGNNEGYAPFTKNYYFEYVK